MARRTDENRAVARLPPGELLKNIKTISDKLQSEEPLDEFESMQLRQIVLALTEEAENVFAYMREVADDVKGLEFQNTAARKIILAEISRYFVLVDKTERIKCWDRLHRALVEQPPKEASKPKSGIQIGGRLVEKPEWLDDQG